MIQSLPSSAPTESHLRSASRRYVKFHHYWEEVERRAKKNHPTLDPDCEHDQSRSPALVVRYEDLCTNLDETMVRAGGGNTVRVRTQ